MMPDFAPFSYYTKNTPVGFEHELLNILSQRTGLVFEKTIAKWSTIYTAFKNKELDLITSISYKKSREPFTTFTNSYYDIPITIFVRDDFGEYRDIKSLKGKKVGVLKDVFYIEELKKIDDINLIYYDTYKEQLVSKWIGSIKEYKGGHVELNKEERAYLNTNIIKYCINPDGLPFEGLNEKDEHVGISSDYYTLFEKILSAKFKLIKTENWNESINYVKNGKCDMIALGMETYERKKYLNFTSSYLKVPLVVATTVDVPFINHIFDLQGQKIGIIKGNAFVKILRQKYPSLNLVEVEDIKEGLDKVKNRKLFGYIDTLASIGYEFQQKYFGELKIAGKIDETLKLSMAVVKENKTLLNILQKTIDSLTNEIHREIFNKWIPIKYQKGVNYELVWKVALGSLLFILLVVYWNRKIIKTNKLLEKAQKDIEEKNIELEKLATTDKLTNLYNRRKMEELLSLEINRSERFGHSFALAIIDIDKFKEVNDTYGHQVGDKVLQEFANILNTNKRKTDFIGRFGGEEFVIICPESDIEGTLKLMENIKEKISQHGFYKVKRKTASFGISISQKADTLESILNRADTALYSAKNSARN